MGDAPAAAVFCGEMCNGCTVDCAACATMACGGCGGCEHGRELSRRARAAGAVLALLHIGSGVPMEFGFNPNQLRGPDGRFIKMGGRGSAGKGGLPKGSGLKNPRVDGDGRPVGSSGGGAGAGGTDTRADSPGRLIAKRKYSDGDRVPLADGTEGTVVGGHHQVAGKPGMYVAVRPDGGGKLKEVAVDAIRKRQIKQAEQGSAPVAEPAPVVPPQPSGGRGPVPVGFTPRSDADWNLTQKRLGKRTARTSSEGELQPGDIVPTRDGKWQEVLGKDTTKFGERYGLIRVRDDAKGYEHTEDPVGVKRQIEAYAAEKAWRDAGGSKDRLDGVATAPVSAEGLRPGEPPIGPDGKYAKPVKMYAVHNGEVFTRTTRNPYRYASVVSFRNPNHPDAEGRHDKVWSWHRTAESAAKGTLTSGQRKGLYVSKVLETSFEDPKMGGETATDAPPSTVAPDAAPARPAAAPRPTRQYLDSYSRQIESVARMVRDAVIDGEGPFSMDKYKERELSDRLQELVDAREAGNTDRVDRVTAQIRKILRDTDTQTEDELPRVPGQTGPTPRFTNSQAVDIIDGLFRQPVGEVLYEDDQTVLAKANEDEDLRVENKLTGKSRVIRSARVDAGEINTAIEDLAK